jgi:hypothetical protein
LSTSQVSSALYRSKEPLKKRLKEQAKIAKWDEQTYYALTEAAEKSHRQLFKLLRQYDSVLEVPVSMLLVNAADGGAEKSAADASLEVTVSKLIRDGDGGVGGEGYSVGDDGSAGGWLSDLKHLERIEDPENLIDPVDEKVAAALVKHATPTAFVVDEKEEASGSADTSATAAATDDDAMKDVNEAGDEQNEQNDDVDDSANGVVWWAAMEPGSDVQAQYKRSSGGRGARQETQKDGDWYAAVVVKRHPLKNWARLVEMRKLGLQEGGDEEGAVASSAWREKALYDLRYVKQAALVTTCERVTKPIGFPFLTAGTQSDD